MKDHLQNCFFGLLLLSSAECFSQHIAVIDRKADTEILFNESDPNSLISIFQRNIDCLGYFIVEDLADSVRATISHEQEEALFRFGQTHGNPPLHFEDTTWLEIEGFTIVKKENGWEVYASPLVDTMIIDLKDISRIILTYKEIGGVVDSIPETLELWKRYDGTLYRTATFEAPDLLSLYGFSLLNKLPDDWNETLIGKKSEGVLWQTARNYSLSRMNFYKNLGLSNLAEPNFSSFDISFFSARNKAPDYLLNYWPEKVRNITSDEYTREIFRDVFPKQWIAQYPLSFELIDLLSEDTLNRSAIHAKFDTVHSVYYQSDIPLFEEDETSVDYGYEKVIYLADGTLEYVYPDPELHYYWIDYIPEVYILENFIKDTLTNEIKTKPVFLYFCLSPNQDKPFLVSDMFIDDEAGAFFIDYPSTKVKEMPWRIGLDEQLAIKKNHFNLTNEKDVKRLQKVNSRLIF